MDDPASAPPRAAYVHVPFCVHRCGYCDFALVANRDDLIDRYLEAIEREILATPQLVEVDTLFFGGGTPTQLSDLQLTRLFEIVRQRLHVADGGEVSVEANPDGLTSEKIRALADAGVNRISLGAQSFDADVLRTLERQHAPAEIVDTVGRIRDRIDNVALDLIFGVPGQSMASWQSTLRAAVELQPYHVSTYGLTIEKGTAFWSRHARGELIPPHTEIERVMYETSQETLSAAGFEQYEVSNFALPGWRCRHNETYWSADPWLAFGPGAARFVNGVRETNHRSVFTWLKRVLEGRSAVAEREVLSREDRAREAIVLGLRRNDGVSRPELQRRFGLVPEQLEPDALQRHLELGNLTDDGSTIRLTHQGRLLADTIVVDFV